MNDKPHKRLRVLKVIVQPVFVSESEDGELVEHVAEPRAMTRSQLLEFANGGLEESIKATERRLGGVGEPAELTQPSPES